MIKKNIMGSISCLVAILITLPVAAGETGVLILGSPKSSIRITLSRMQADPISFETVDPNFKDAGMTRFTGISLKKLMTLADVEVKSGITVVGEDHYVGYITRKRVEKEGVILAWEIGGRAITPLNGGPLKIIFKDGKGVHGSAYTWHVAAIFVDSMKSQDLEIVLTDKSRKWVFPEFEKQPLFLDEREYSIPNGWRTEFQQKPGRISCISLKTLLTDHGLEAATRIRLVPHVGASLTMDASLIREHPVLLAGLQGDTLLHPVFGGPLCLVFPLESHAALIGTVPESGALFFLKTIMLD